MQFSNQSQSLLRCAAANARSLGHSYVGSIHLLLALLHQRDLAASLLNGCGMQEEVVRDMTVILCGIVELPARICELKRLGYNITSEKGTSHNRFGTVHFNIYKLED